ncbi:T-complex protein 11 homolog isoform X2 [Gallus gallus]|uniref:T-complex protein 11 homolog isoform X2 n=1 Tax=Gallus gallus TaxID=9031 RepID=UPI001AEB37D8|nr:T-complex protein 11 homolog isoform X2 [Gallus gallus]
MAGAEPPPRPNDTEEAAGPRESGEERPLGPGPASSPQILSTNELQELSDEVFRLSTVHEIVLNADLKVHMVNFPPHSLENRVKETLHKAFWDRLKKQISASPPDYTQAIQLLQEIKEALLLLLLPQNSQLRSQIEGVLDLELIRQEAEHGALDIHGLSTSILSTMAMLCAPFRDEEVQGLQSLTDPVELLREIFRVLDLMKMDMLNFTIQNLRPYLQECYVQYEQEKFQKILDKLPNSLDNTTEWLRRAAAAEVSASSLQSQSCPATSSSPDAHFQGAVNSNTTVPSAMSVLNRGYMDLLCWEPGQNEYPETLLLDQARLQEVQAQVNQLTIIAAVLLVTSGVCGSTLFDSPGFIARLKLVTKVLLEGLSSIRTADSSVSQPFYFPRWTKVSKRFPKGPRCHSGRAAGSRAQVQKCDLPQQAGVWPFLLSHSQESAFPRGRTRFRKRFYVIILTMYHTGGQGWNTFSNNFSNHASACRKIRQTHLGSTATGK